MASLCRYLFHVECEAGINKQINLELHASYVYMAMAYNFSRDDVALNGFHKFFLKQSLEEREHAMKFMDYQNRRGGRIVLQNVSPPETNFWGTGLEAMEAALELEKSVYKSLHELHTVAETHNDPQFCDFLEGEFLEEQVKSIKEISDYVTNLRRVGPGAGEYLFDKETLHGEDD
ncbi:Ferritin heavy chain [Fasciola gigantica]|uniref:Ferritin n=1 Tax=Fasciola gigantica TaxID=46835 RepID=A0A504YA13_FASGI|nr:Ferritin heavy chain [Fasciola gigantica]